METTSVYSLPLQYQIITLFYFAVQLGSVSLKLFIELSYAIPLNVIIFLKECKEVKKKKMIFT